METTTGLREGDYTLLRVLYNGNMIDVITLIGNLSGGGINSVTLPLSINSGVLSVDLTGCIPITHEASKIGTGNVNMGAFDVNTRTLTLENSSGVTAVLEVDLGGNLNLNGYAGIMTVPALNAWQFLSITMKDVNATVYSLSPNSNGTLSYNGSTLAFLSELANYSTTTQMNTLLATKQNTLTPGAGVTISNI